MNCPSIEELPPPPPGKTGWPWTEAYEASPPFMEDGGSWPKISIITPTYNHEAYIEETIRSVLLQGYPNLEYIVVNDGSPDNTDIIIKKYDKWLSFRISRTELGFPYTLNEGFSYATGCLTGWINSDDYYLPGALFKLAETWRNNKASVAWTGCAEKITKTGELLGKCSPRLGKGGTPKEFCRVGKGAVVYQPSTLFSTEALKQAGPFDLTIETAVDIDLWPKLAAIGSFTIVEQVISRIRMYPEVKHLRDKAEVIVELISICNKNGFKDIAKEWLHRYLENPENPY